MDKVIMKVFKSIWSCLPSLVLVLCIGRCLAVIPPQVYFLRIKDGGQALSAGMGAVPRLSISGFLLNGYCADLKIRNSPMYQKTCSTEGVVKVPVPEKRHRKPSPHMQSYPPLYSWRMPPVCYYTYTWWYPQMVCHPFNPYYG